MTLIEVLVSTLVFALAANSSAQLWGSALTWNHRAVERQELLNRIDMELLKRERALRVAAAAQVKSAREAGVEVPMSCGDAVAWMEGQLALVSSQLPEQITLATDLALTTAEEPVALWLRASGEGIERRRLFAPAAHGVCRL